MVAALPLLALPVIAYNLLVWLVLPGGRHAFAARSTSRGERVSSARRK